MFVFWKENSKGFFYKVQFRNISSTSKEIWLRAPCNLVFIFSTYLSHWGALEWDVYKVSCIQFMKHFFKNIQMTFVAVMYFSNISATSLLEKTLTPISAHIFNPTKILTELSSFVFSCKWIIGKMWLNYSVLR